MTSRSVRRGRLVAIEGVDGAGKSTFARSLAEGLRRRGRTVALRREPADASLGLLAQRASRVDPWTGGVYFTLDRALARPSLERDLVRHDVVVTDRSYHSTLAYQGSALAPAPRRRLEALQRSATVAPDRVVLLALDPSRALRRVGARSSGRGPLERLAILRRVDRAYRSLARSGDWIVLDARQPTSELVVEAIHCLAGVGERPVARRRR